MAGEFRRSVPCRPTLARPPAATPTPRRRSPPARPDGPWCLGYLGRPRDADGAGDGEAPQISGAVTPRPKVSSGSSSPQRNRLVLSHRGWSLLDAPKGPFRGPVRWPDRDSPEWTVLSCSTRPRQVRRAPRWPTTQLAARHLPLDPSTPQLAGRP